MFKKTGRKPPVSRNAYMALALAGNMITLEEKQAIEKGEMRLDSSHIYRRKADGVFTSFDRIYHNRADEVLIKKLLGEDPNA